MMMLQKGQPFMDVPADFTPEEEREAWKGADPPPTFSEMFLYATVGKGDARFILGVAEEYEHLIDLFGPELTKRLLSAGLGRGSRERLRRTLDELITEEAV